MAHFHRPDPPLAGRALRHKEHGIKPGTGHHRPHIHARGAWRRPRSRRPRALEKAQRRSGSGQEQPGNAVTEFHEGLTSGTSLHEALGRLDVLYAGYPGRWRFVSAWGTNEPLTLADYDRVGQSQEAAAFLQWAGPEGRTAAGAGPAEALARTRQVWFTFRTDVGFVHFFVTLDERGVITAVSEIVGHQA